MVLHGRGNSWLGLVIVSYVKHSPFYYFDSAIAEAQLLKTSVELH